jgi:hypothetical protein
VDPPDETQPFFGFDDVGGDPGFNADPEFDTASDLSAWTTVCDPAGILRTSGNGSHF